MNMKSKPQEIEVQLCEFLQDFEIPEFRKDATKEHNLLWLHENLHLKNVTNKNYDEVRMLLRLLMHKLGVDNE